MRSTSPDRGRPEKVVRIDPAAERAVLAAMLVDAATCARLVRALPPDRWQVPEHRAAVAALAELARHKVAYDAGAARRVAPELDTNYLDALAAERPAATDLAFWVEAVRWDSVRADVVRGPLADLLELVGDPKADPAKVRTAAKAVGQGFGAWRDRARVRHPDDVLAAACANLDARLAGLGVYPYGLAAIDAYEGGDGVHREGEPRLVPGAKPDKVTVITGTSGSGKSTVACRVALGQARLRKRVAYGAWEMDGPESLELLAVMSLAEQDWRTERGRPVSRKTLMTGQPREDAVQMVAAVKFRMRELSPFVRFIDNPFDRRQASKPSNDRNLDIIEHVLEDLGADVFVADLWERCIVDDEPSQVGQALFRQQEMCARLKCHAILLQQQRLKDVEARADRRPTREGIKGSAAWVEIADTILGCYRPALWKAVTDDLVVVDVLKQRYAEWPLTIEVQWDPDRAWFGAGTSVPYDQPGAGREGPSEIDAFTGGAAPKPRGRGRGRDR